METQPVAAHPCHCHERMEPGCGCRALAERGRFLLAVAGVIISISAFFGGLAAGLLAN